MSEKFEFRVLKSYYLGEAMNVLLATFCKSDPCCACLGVTVTDFNKAFHSLVKASILQNVCVGVFDKKFGEMCGVIVNLLGQEDLPKDTIPLERQTIKMLQQLYKENSLKTRKYLEVSLMGVKEEYGKQGIASELIKRSVNLAERFGCLYVVSACTSDYSRRAFIRNKFVSKNEIIYSDYVDPITGKKIFETTSEPHRAASLMVKKL